MTRLIQLSLAAFFLFTAAVSADTTSQTIVLQDGSILKGTVTKMENGVYTIATEKLGAIEIKDTDVVSIQASNSQAVLPIAQTGVNQLTGSNLQSQVQALQGNILNDPELMKDIMHLMDDPQVQSMITDKNFVNDIMSMDQNKLQNNDKINQLMTNPKMQELMGKIQARLPAAAAQEPVNK